MSVHQVNVKRFNCSADEALHSKQKKYPSASGQRSRPSGAWKSAPSFNCSVQLLWNCFTCILTSALLVAEGRGLYTCDITTLRKSWQLVWGHRFWIQAVCTLLWTGRYETFTVFMQLLDLLYRKKKLQHGTFKAFRCAVTHKGACFTNGPVELYFIFSRCSMTCV